MNPQIEEELITCINYDTKTVNLLDRFEGFDKQGFVYKRIVIKNPIFKVYYHNLTVNYHLVIERRSELDYVGDITFTKLKKGDTNELNQHIKSEITNDIINKYIDKNRFYRFSKPFLLRAQNSSNRSGYGWEWDWSGGIGSYTKGTLYGETTNYVITGVYVSSNFFYEPENREPFGDSI